MLAFLSEAVTPKEKQKQERNAKTDQLWIPELDEMAKKVEEKHGLDRVQVFQSRSLARITLVVKGDIEKTTEKIKELEKILTT